MEGKSFYQVNYSVTSANESHGEFSSSQLLSVQSYKSPTNDLKEVFIDLVELHRQEPVIGIEILSVELIPEWDAFRTEEEVLFS